MFPTKSKIWTCLKKKYTIMYHLIFIIMNLYIYMYIVSNDSILPRTYLIVMIKIIFHIVMIRHDTY